MIVYNSVIKYIESAQSLKDKLAKIDAIMPMLYDSLIKASLSANLEEYELDNGQTKIRTRYKSAEAVVKAIDALQYTRDKLQAVLNKNTHGGSITRLVDINNLTGQYNGRNNRG